VVAPANDAVVELRGEAGIIGRCYRPYARDCLCISKTFIHIPRVELLTFEQIPDIPMYSMDSQ
jgi:hypothetical protein